MICKETDFIQNMSGSLSVSVLSNTMETLILNSQEIANSYTREETTHKNKPQLSRNQRRDNTQTIYSDNMSQRLNSERTLLQENLNLTGSDCQIIHVTCQNNRAMILQPGFQTKVITTVGRLLARSERGESTNRLLSLYLRPHSLRNKTADSTCKGK